MSVRVQVAPTVLEWARDRSGRTDEDVERRFHAWREWLAGHADPTIAQLEELAHYVRVPFGALFLPEPPRVELPIPDFRRRAGRRGSVPSQDLLDVIYASEQRRAWYRDYALRQHAEPVAVVGAGRNLDVATAARFATEALRYPVAGRDRRSRNDARNHLRHAFEGLGGLAVFAGIVGNDTHRPLDRDEFRGFTLADDLAPLVFVNANDTLAGQVFTFLHEFGHVLRAETGVSDEDVSAPASDDAEAWCDAFAAEVLVPARDLRAQFRADATLRDELDRLADRYLCSTLVVLIRLRDLELVPRRGFDEAFAAEARHVEDLVAQVPRAAGGDFYRNQRFRVGERLARAVIADTREGGTPFGDALRLLRLNTVQQMDRLAGELGVR